MPETRKNTTLTATIATGGNLSDEIDMTLYAGMIVHMPSTWDSASIGFYVSSISGGIFTGPLKDDDGNIIQIDSPSVDEPYAAPAGLFPARFVKLFSHDGSGNAVNQTTGGTDREIAVDLKA